MNFGIEVRKLFDVIWKVFNNKIGLTKPIEFLRGAKSMENTNRKGTTDLFGSGKSRPDIWWKELGKLLRNNGYLLETKSSFSQFGFITQLSDKAINWYENDEKVINIYCLNVILNGFVNARIFTGIKIDSI